MLVSSPLRVRVATPTTQAPPAAPTSPGSALVVPGPIRDAISGAAQVGRDATSAFFASHPATDAWLFRSYIVKAGGYAPGREVEQQELAMLHELQAGRTPEATAEALEFDRDGSGNLWKQLVSTSDLSAGDQARVVSRIETALTFANDVAQTVKGASMRSRPFVVDPTITPLGRVPGNNPSFPSGHATAAFAAAEVLAGALPQRRAEFEELATRIAFSRMYAGMHFQSDVAAGARIGAMVGAFLVEHDHAQLRRTDVPEARSPSAQGVSGATRSPGARA